MFDIIRKNLRKLANIHCLSKDSRNILLLTTPRSGSTWLMEILLSQKKIKPCNEPFDIRNYYNSNMLCINNWEDLYRINKSDDICLNHLNGFLSGRFHYGYKNLIPFEKGYNFFTNKIIFKILHACEDKIRILEKNTNAKVILLFRHPIAVSLSRKELPRLKTFIKGDYNRFFNSNQLDYAKKILENGSFLEKAVLDWCLQNYLLLNDISKDWIILTYEQLVIEPDIIISKLKEEFKDLNIKDIMSNIKNASRTTHKSDNETKKKFQEKSYDKKWLTQKWLKKVSIKEKNNVSTILNMFDIDIYKADSPIANQKYWI